MKKKITVESIAKKKKVDKFFKKYSYVLAVTIILLSIVGVSVPFSFNDHKYTIAVTDKEKINTEDNSKYLVFADIEDKSVVFENVDTLLRGKFNSSNIQGELKIGETYEITVVGYRVPLLSMYENIIKINTSK